MPEKTKPLNYDELLQEGKDELASVLDDYSAFDFTFKDEPSYWGEDGRACIATIKPRYHPTAELHMRLEVVEQGLREPVACIEMSEDNWEEVYPENVWKWLYFYTLDKIPRSRE